MISTIRLELEGMRHTMVTAFSEHQGVLEAEVRSAVENYCTPENLQSVIRAEAKRCLDSAVKRAIDNYFQFGEGRDAVNAAVIAMIKEGEA